MERLAEKYADQADFAFIYCKEAHPNAAAPVTNEGERLAMARKFVREMKVKQRVLVDEFDTESVQKLYNSLENSVFILDKKGLISSKFPISYPQNVEDHLRAMLDLPPVVHPPPVGMPDSLQDAPKPSP